MNAPTALVAQSGDTYQLNDVWSADPRNVHTIAEGFSSREEAHQYAVRRGFSVPRLPSPKPYSPNGVK